MAADDTYAPKSPDLSSFYSAGPTPPAPQLSRPGFQSKNYLHADYIKREPEPQTFAYPFSPTSSSSNIPPSTEYHHQPPQYYQQQQYQQVPLPQFDQPRTFKTESYPPYSPSPRNQYQPPEFAQGLPASLDYDHQQAPYQQQPYGQPYHDQKQYNNAPPYPEPHAQSKGAPLASSKSPKSEPRTSTMPPRRAPPPPAPVIDPSPVRTKFPTARIKRIMQADEEVGKVAQQTPIAVGKALELFMIQMVTKSAEVAQEKGSKRVTAAMLKQVVETDEQWDFLRDIVGRVENEKEGKSKAKVESSSDEEIPEPKKRTRGGGRKKKAA